MFNPCEDAMFIYADEPGNSGYNIFDDKQPIYRQGAILSCQDINEPISEVVKKHFDSYGIPQLHAKELGYNRAAEILPSIIDAAASFGEWSFHVTEIEKTYLPTTKFVDTVFDSGENPSAHWF
jgi:hypothetical protein